MAYGKRFHYLIMIGLFLISVSYGFAVSRRGGESITSSHPNPNFSANSVPIQYNLQVCAHEKVAGAVTSEKILFLKNDRREVALVCGITNQTNSKIKSVKGILRFTDYFGSPLFEMPMTYEGPLAPGEAASKTVTLRRPHFPDEKSFDSFLRTPLARMRQTWIPTEMVLSDGSILKP